jgi:hypothetical protein
MSKFGKPCYYCGKLSTGKEHIPPQMLFKEIVCDKITVPSCDHHNMDKSGIDQSIIAGFSLSLQSLKKDPKFKNVTDKVPQNAFNSGNFKTKDCVKKSVYLKPIISPFTGAKLPLPDMSYLESVPDLKDWLIKITAGLVRDGLRRFEPNIDWNSAITVNPSVTNLNGIKGLEETQRNVDRANEIKSKKPWYRGWPSGKRDYPKNVFQFCLHFTNNKTFFYYTFYSVFHFYVEITLNTSIQKELFERKPTVIGVYP